MFKIAKDGWYFLSGTTPFPLQRLTYPTPPELPLVSLHLRRMLLPVLGDLHLLLEGDGLLLVWLLRDGVLSLSLGGECFGETESLEDLSGEDDLLVLVELG